MPTLIYETACRFTERGFSVIPVWLKSKAPKVKWTTYQTRQPTDAELRKWFAGPSNAALVCGFNNLCVLDFDEMGEYTHWMLWCASTGGYQSYIAGNAYRVATRRGVHVYLRSRDKIRNMHLGKVDIRGQSGLAMMAGSIHPNGHEYRAMITSYVFPFFTELKDILPPDVLARKVEYDTAFSHAPIDLSVSAMDLLNTPVGPGVTIDQIKAVWRLEEFFPNVIRTGPLWALTQCPLHKDENPSFWIDFDKQLCGCFSGCTDKPMDVINLYARIHQVSLQSAIQEMSARVNH